MELLKLEFVAFLDKNYNPEHAAIPSLMSEFAFLELYPQFIQETNLATKLQSKVMCLINNISGFSITFNTDKLLISQDISPDSNAQFADEIQKFHANVVACLDRLNNIYYKDYLFKRFAVVATAVRLTSEQEKNNFIDGICTPIDGAAGNVELKLRFTHRENLQFSSETHNVTTLINDGRFEKTDTHTGISARSSCFLIQTDINSLEEMNSPRFSVENLKNHLSQFIETTERQLRVIVEKF